MPCIRFYLRVRFSVTILPQCNAASSVIMLTDSYITLDPFPEIHVRCCAGFGIPNDGK
jgi:hypothetical protein